MAATTESLQFYINGQWVDPSGSKKLDVINPANEDVLGQIALGTAADVDKAVAAAKEAFETFSQTSKEERLALMGKFLEIYQSRLPDLADTISHEMGAPMWLAKLAQAPSGMAHLAQAIKILKNYEFSELRGTTRIVKEPVGVCGFITPWNWPVNQILCKVAPALAAGCTMVLKPSEVAPFSAVIVAEMIEAAGIPAGVFNMVQGDGPTVGAAISAHPDIDFVSFTGSTRAGREIAKAGAESIKRVAQELGGKSANIVLDDADLEKAVRGGVQSCFMNSGQSCNAPTRMFVPEAKHADALRIAKEAAEATVAGPPEKEE